MKKTSLLFIFLYLFILSSFSYNDMLNLRIADDGNEHFSEAINLTPTNYFSIPNYSKLINDVSDTSLGVVDTDYFFFKISNISKVKITLNINSNAMLDIYLQYVYNLASKDKLGSQLNDIYYDFSDSKYKNYEGELNQGTYYVIIRGKQDKAYNELIDYTLNLNVECIYQPLETVNLNNFMNSNNIGLYCGLNYDKLNYLTVSDYNYNMDIKDHTHLDFFLIDLLQTRLNEDICIGSLYIYDKDVKNSISDFFKFLSNYLKINIINDLEKDIIFDKIVENTEGLSTSVQIILKIYGKDVLVKILNLSIEVVVKS